MAIGVQFTNRNQVSTAYQTNEVDTWAIFSGKLLFMKGSGIDELNAALDLLENNATNTIYTLKVYENILPKQVKPKTEEDGGFNFYLNSPDMMLTVAQHQRLYPQHNNEILSVINGLKADIQSLKEEKEEPSRLGMIGEVLDHPVLGSILEKIALKFVDSMIPATSGNTAANASAAAIPMRAVGNVATDSELLQALEKLKQFDPQLTEHLKKLALIAEHDKGTWTIIVGALDKME